LTPFAPTDLSSDCLEDQLVALRAELHRTRALPARSEVRLDAIARLFSDGFRTIDRSLRSAHCTGGRDGADDLAGRLLGRAPSELPATVPLSGEWDALHPQLESGRPFAEFVCVTRALWARAATASFRSPASPWPARRTAAPAGTGWPAT